MPKSNGAILWKGESEIDGAPIVLIATGLNHNSSNVKTGAMIRAAAEGTALVLGLTPELQKSCRDFGTSLGLCFQLKDDLLDSEKTIEPGSYPATMGLEATRQFLLQNMEKAQTELKQMQIETGPLWDLIAMNFERQI